MTPQTAPRASMTQIKRVKAAQAKVPTKARIRAKMVRAREAVKRGIPTLPTRVEAEQLVCRQLQHLRTVLATHLERNGRSLMTMRWWIPTIDPYATHMCVESVKSLVLRVGIMVPLPLP